MMTQHQAIGVAQRLRGQMTVNPAMTNPAG